ncbi:MAG: hypothetical protein WC647_11095 [Desulfomonilaceae bacterium]
MSWADAVSRFNNIVADPRLWNARVRIGFWVFGLLAGGILAYTTRHYVNGDAIAYMDMAEAFRKGLWKESVLLGYSPGYSILLAIFESLVPSTVLNELFVVKFLNFVLFVTAMAACNLFINRLKDEIDVGRGRTVLPPHVMKAVCFSLFLVASLIWVRIQIVAPDILIFTFVLLSLVAVLNIKRSPDAFFNFACLGLSAGLGYICKTFFFPFSAIFFALASLYCSSLRKAIPRILLSVGVMLIVSSPVVISQSLKAGHLSIGEVGSYNYTYYVAGEGSPVHLPRLVHSDPDVLVYDEGTLSTFPHGDPAYWALGIKPVLKLKTQFKAIVRNFFDLVAQIWGPTLVMLIWFFAQFRNAQFSIPRIRPPSVLLTLILLCLAGTGIYCLVSMEIRYVAAFLFLGFTALVFAPEYKFSDFGKCNAVMFEAVLVVAFMVGMIIGFVLDQSHRALNDSGAKISHRGTFMEMSALKDYLNSNGLGKHDRIAIFYPVNCKLYWARMAGVRVVGEIMDVQGFLENTAQKREDALNSLKKIGLKAVVVKQPEFIGLLDEGWNKVPGTRQYFVHLLTEPAL